MERRTPTPQRNQLPRARCRWGCCGRGTRALPEALRPGRRREALPEPMGREGDEAAAETVAGPHHDLRGPPVGERGGGVGTGTGEEARPGDGPVRRQAPPRRLPGGERAPGVAVPVLPEGRGAGPLWAGPWPSAEGRHSAGSCVPVSGGQRLAVRAAGSGAGRAVFAR